MRQIIIFLLLWIALGSCQQGFTIDGKIENMPEQKFRLEELAFDANVFVDSGKTNSDGSFSIKNNGKEESLYRIKFLEGKYILLALKNGDHVTLKGNWNELHNYTVEGSEGSLALKSFLVNLRENMTDMKTMQTVLDSIKRNPEKDSLRASAEADLRTINSSFLIYVKKFADTTKSVASALFAVNIINPAVEGPYIQSFYQTITKRFPSSETAKAFAEKFLQRTPAAAIEPIGAKKGTPAADFTANTPDGKTVSLQSFRGKYVLLDFWASWCAPCRRENPNVVQAYQQFKDKNFSILGVSLDTDQAKWKEAIAKDGLTWTHVSELKGWGSTIARNYGIESIPQNFLIDPQGNIIASNLRGEQLLSTLTEHLK